MASLNTAQLISECGEKCPGYCGICRQPYLYELPATKGQDGKALRLCSWCDVDVEHRWQGFKDLDAA